MKIKLAIVVLLCLLPGCQGTVGKFSGEAFVVTHSPNPSNLHTSEYFPKPPYPYMWYYRTEVKNTSDRDLKVIWFEGYFEYNGQWYGSNVRNMVLRNGIFRKWYGDGKSNDEWIKPGESRVCDPNWHGASGPKGYRSKWAFIAIDRYGNDYFAEAVIEGATIEDEHVNDSVKPDAAKDGRTP
jgi:hypothetical protein